jgi:hypothetical protein
MKNHWTDKKAVNDFIDKVSIKLSDLLKVNPAKIRAAIEDDLRNSPLSDCDMQELRKCDITDDVIKKMVEMIPDDVMAGFNQLDGADGLW